MITHKQKQEICKLETFRGIKYFARYCSSNYAMADKGDKKAILFTICLSTKEIEEQILKLKNRNYLRFCARQRTVNSMSKGDEQQMKTNAIELPPITKGEKTGLVSCPTPVALPSEEIEDGKISRLSERSRPTVPRLKKELPKKSIRQVKPCPPGSVVEKNKIREQDKTNEFVCFGVHMKAKISKNRSEEKAPSFRNEKLTPDMNSNRHRTTDADKIVEFSDSNFVTNAFPELPTTTGPVFRPWSKTRKENFRFPENVYENFNSFPRLDWKLQRFFALSGTVREVNRNKQVNNCYRGSIRPLLKSYNSIADLTIDTTGSYGTKDNIVRAKATKSAKGGGADKHMRDVEVQNVT